MWVWSKDVSLKSELLTNRFYSGFARLPVCAAEGIGSHIMSPQLFPHGTEVSINTTCDFVGPEERQQFAFIHRASEWTLLLSEKLFLFLYVTFSYYFVVSKHHTQWSMIMTWSTLLKTFICVWIYMCHRVFNPPMCHWHKRVLPPLALRALTQLVTEGQNKICSSIHHHHTIVATIWWVRH